MKNKTIAIALFIAMLNISATETYPIDGYIETGIRRLARLQLIVDGQLKEPKPVPGAMKSIEDIQLNLLGDRGATLDQLPQPDESLQNAINALFPGLSQSYSVAVLDITPNKPIRYAQRKSTTQYQPGSVGKIAVAHAMFNELQKLYPDSFEDRQDLLRTKMVRAGRWAMSDHHTVPFYDPRTGVFFKRTVQESDVFSLYEWLDHMLSVSNNGAASVCWREAILIRVFQEAYPTLTEEEAENYFKTTPKSELSNLAIAVVNDPLRELGITTNEWRLGTFFTKGAGSYIPGKGGSTGSPQGLLKYLIAMERGLAIDEASSLEIKRLLYMTDRRIRYAASPTLAEAAVYFKSGSLYKCKPEDGYECGKYKGNVDNYMNSVAIVEHPDNTTYLVVLMSNVLKKNSGTDHMYLASSIDKVIQK